ncbi:MAG: hypothetical protein R2758_06890 [Bacteroidales bacterium]
MKKAVIITVIVAAVMLDSCGSIETLPPEPMIEFRTFTVYDSIDILGNPAKAGKLTFYFEDGDGDLGLDPPQNPGTDPSGNLFLRLYRKTNGVFELAGPSDPLYPSEYRIPYIEAEGQNKILKGTIDVTLMYLLYNASDTLYYDFWIRDRGGNDSNTATTCVVVLGENGTCSPE